MCVYDKPNIVARRVNPAIRPTEHCQSYCRGDVVAVAVERSHSPTWAFKQSHMAPTSSVSVATDDTLATPHDGAGQDMLALVDDAIG